MKSIVLTLIFLLALFTVIRANASEKEDTRLIVHPGVLEMRSGESGVNFTFGYLEGAGSGRKVWNIFPIRISLSSGDKQLDLGLNGLSFITRSGINIGKPVFIKGVKRGDVISLGGEVKVEGSVEGNIWAFGADIYLLPGSQVTGDVVSLGGNIEADRKSLIKGNKQAFPDFNLPFFGLLASEHSAATFLFIIEVLTIVLYLIILFLVIHFAAGHLGGLVDVMHNRWRGSLLYLGIAIILTPLLLLLLAGSILGILIIPLFGLFLIIATYLGCLGFSVRLGLWIRGAKETTPLSLYTSGLLGLLIIRGPVVLGILLTLLTSNLMQNIGRFMMMIGTAAFYLSCLYGLGCVLLKLRLKSNLAPAP